MARPILVHTDNSSVLSSQSMIALSRCSSLYESILGRIVPDHKTVFKAKAISAAQRPARSAHAAAQAKIYGETHARPAQSWQLFPVFTIITDTSSFLQHAYLTCAFQALCTCGKSVCIKGSLQTPRGRASCMEAWGRSGPIWRGNGSLRAMAM